MAKTGTRSFLFTSPATQQLAFSLLSSVLVEQAPWEVSKVGKGIGLHTLYEGGEHNDISG